MAERYCAFTGHRPKRYPWGSNEDDFRTGPADFFQKPFHVRQPIQPEPPGMKRGRHCKSTAPALGHFVPKEFYFVNLRFINLGLIYNR